MAKTNQTKNKRPTALSPIKSGAGKRRRRQNRSALINVQEKIQHIKEVYYMKTERVMQLASTIAENIEQKRSVITNLNKKTLGFELPQGLVSAVQKAFVTAQPVQAPAQAASTSNQASSQNTDPGLSFNQYMDDILAQSYFSVPVFSPNKFDQMVDDLFKEATAAKNLNTALATNKENIRGADAISRLCTQRFQDLAQVAHAQIANPKQG